MELGQIRLGFEAKERMRAGNSARNPIGRQA